MHTHTHAARIQTTLNTSLHAEGGAQLTRCVVPLFASRPTGRVASTGAPPHNNDGWRRRSSTIPGPHTHKHTHLCMPRLTPSDESTIPNPHICPNQPAHSHTHLSPEVGRDNTHTQNTPPALGPLVPNNTNDRSRKAKAHATSTGAIRPPIPRMIERRRTATPPSQPNPMLMACYSRRVGSLPGNSILRSRPSPRRVPGQLPTERDGSGWLARMRGGERNVHFSRNPYLPRTPRKPLEKRAPPPKKK